MAKRREFNVFSLSFLDIMSCGFGAVILIFIIINHSTETSNLEINAQLLAEIKEIEEDIEDETENLLAIKNTIDETEDDIVTTEELIQQLVQAIKQLEAQIVANLGTSEKEIEKLKADLKRLEEEASLLELSLSENVEGGENLYSFIGEGDRQYLTGLKVGGENILILLDASASMLDKTIVNIVRTRNLSDTEKIRADKWQRAVRTIEWITANMPRNSNFQLFTFNTTAQSAIPEKESQWLSTGNKEDLENVLEHVKSIIPTGGTSLHHPFSKARAFEPPPDNIFLIVDGLPTQGFDEPTSTLVSSQERSRLFVSAISEVPNNTPVNVILFPMEGDPLAAASYWRLAQITTGSFLAPSEDWP